MRALILSAGVLAWSVSTSASAMEAAPAGAASCSGCHAAAADAASPVPRLAGQQQAAIVRAMQDFRTGARPATVMDRIARGYTDGEIQAIAEWYSRQR